MTARACPGCGLVALPDAGPTHPYMLSSPGCWARYGELIASGGGGQPGVDAYAVQHPGVDERRARQSVAVHLISLCATLEHRLPPERAVDLFRRALAAPPPGGWPWLAPVLPIGSLTVANVLAAPSAARPARVGAWAEELWAAYGAQQATVRGWLTPILRVG